MKKKLSIRSIAQDLNISVTAVSFVLNGRAREKRISDKLADRILQYVEKMDFKPNQLARSLSTGKTMLIGLMVEKISDYFFAKVAYHIEELAYKNGYKIIYCSTENDARKARELITMFRDRHVDGYIITPPAGIEQEIQELIQENLPVVLFDRFFPSVLTDYVVLDNFNGTYNAVNHLVERNYRNIVFVELDSDQTQMQQRELGYLKAIEEHRLSPLIKKVPFGYKDEIIVKKLVQLLESNKEIDAFFFATNYLAMSGIKALNKQGLRVPDDVAIVAFDDHDVFDTYSPTITAVAQPIDKMAQQLIKILLYKLEHKFPQSGLKQIIVPAKLVLRDSTKKK